MPTTVVNIRRRGGVGAAFDVYIGRSMYRGGWQLPGSKWANPYVIGRDGTREEVIARFREYILENPELRAELPELRGRVLGCCGAASGIGTRPPCGWWAKERTSPHAT